MFHYGHQLVTNYVCLLFGAGQVAFSRFLELKMTLWERWERWEWTRAVNLYDRKLNNELKLTIKLHKAEWLQIQVIILCRFIATSEHYTLSCVIAALALVAPGSCLTSSWIHILHLCLHVYFCLGCTYDVHVCPCWKRDSSSVALPEVSFLCSHQKSFPSSEASV